MKLRTRIFLRAASLLVLLVAGTCATVLVLALNRQDDEVWATGTLTAVLEVGIAMLVLGAALSVWVARATTREVDRARQAVEETNQRLQKLATTDELTGLRNRRYLVEALKAEIERVSRQNTRLALAMFDVDQFKPINDACGHALGDRVLCEIAKALREAARTTDVVARYAGDEFVVLMPGTSVEEAVSAAERLRQAVEHRRVVDGCRGVRVSISAGVAALRTGQTDTPDTLLLAAVEALLAAKDAWRNCVRAWGQEADQATDETSVNREAVERLRSRVVALSHRSRELFVRGVRVLVHEQESRDPYAKHHSENVAHYAACIAQTLGLDFSQVGVIRRAGLLHDIGKIGVSDEILWKPSGLTADERKLMQRHVVVGVRILDQLRFLEREVPLVRHHHERYDGRGYPDGISGETIPLGARILGVADAFDAIIADRPYRESRTVAQALQIIVEDSGRQFDPQVVDAILQWVASVSRDHGKVGNITIEDLCENRPAEIEAAEEVTA
ncbi:MAG: diguanylate cyclase [Planctomycetota bacterium]|nr:diguanylate cyclase [Planctomycetota bacterium]